METDMTLATTYHTGFSPIATAEGWLARVRKALADRMLYSRTLAELSGLSDRDLNDLGILRHDIDRVARESIYSA
jgi:uncharacterized protein YjiS (DUF1127 family)